MPARHVSIERLSVVSAKPFAEVLAAIDAAIGHPDIRRMQQDVAAAKTYDEMEIVINKLTGASGLMEFLRLDMGAYIGKGRSGTTPRSVRLLVGNPLIMRQMAEHVADAAGYAPVTILIDERDDGVHLSYDRMASYLAPYQSAAASVVAENLDRKVEMLLASAAK